MQTPAQAQADPVQTSRNPAKPAVGKPGFLDRLRPGRQVDGAYSVTCSSIDNRYTACAWDARRGRPYLLHRFSNQTCSNGYSWGYDASTGLWVNHGCRARFGAR